MNNIDTNKRLLIVDDDEVFCSVLGKAMSRRGFVINTAHTCASAIETATKIKPDYAVIDLRIDKESGLVVVERLNKIFPSIKMIILTGFANIATAVEAIKLGAMHYLTKPATPEEIIKAFSSSSDVDSIQIPENPLSVKRLEWEHINNVLTQHDGNISAAARALGMHRRSLQRKLQKKPSRH